MKLTAAQVLELALVTVACSPEIAGTHLGGSGGTPSSGGAAMSGGVAGIGETGGATASGGTPASGGVDGGGAAATGGVPASGGAAAGGTASGGANGEGTSGGAPASGGAESLLAVAFELDGLRLDDPCAGTPSVSTGATCDHTVLTGPGFRAEAPATIGGAPTTTYDVTIRVRGVTEPTNVAGGERTSSETFSYMDLDWRTEPFTLGGAVPADDTDYAQWCITVDEPAATYFLNDYQRVGHYIFELDYELTIPMQGSTTVTLSATDSNERLILNYEGYAPEGVAGSSNHGQFVELELVAVQEH